MTTTYTNEQIAMTLAAIAYANEVIPTTIKELLDKPDLATQQQWKLVWGPHEKGTNQAYVVQQGSSNTYALAIRGTEFADLLSWLLDLETDLVPVPFSCSVETAKISEGMADIYDHLTTMPDLFGKKLPDFIEKLPTGSTLWVTGHSQGGASASMMALWAASSYSNVSVQPYTFAGETAGDSGFAAAFEAALLGQPGGRYANEYDLVPRAFQGLSTLPDLYSAQKIVIPSLAQKWIDDHKDLASQYVQPLDVTTVSTNLVPPSETDPRPDDEYVEEVLVQHSHIGYLYSMGAPYLPIDSSYVYPTHLEH